MNTLAISEELNVKNTHDKLIKTGFFSVLRFAHKRKWPLIFSISLLVIASVCVVFSAKFLGALVQTLTKQEGEYLHTVKMYGLGFFLFELLGVVLQYWGRVSMAKVSNGIIYDLRSRLYRKMNQLPISYYDTQPIGRTITRLTSDVVGVETLFVNTLGRLLLAIFTIVVVFIAMVVIDPLFGLMITLSVLPAFFLNIVTKNYTREKLRVFKRDQSIANANLAEMMGGIQLLKLFNLEKWSLQEYDKKVIRFFYSCLDYMNWNTFLRPATVLLCSIPTILVFYFAGHKVLAGTLEVSVFVIYIRYCEYFLGPVRSISQEIQQIQDAFSSAERVDVMLQEVEESRLIESGTITRKIHGDVEYKNIFMSYQKDRMILNDISFSIRAGEKVGFVGTTGSGKSTTVNLLPRLYNHSHGDIFIDGQNINDWNLESLRSQMGVVSQEVVIYEGTLRENLSGALKNPNDVTDDELWEACKKTGLIELLEKLPDGLDSPVYDGGENFSLGEKQLIALTRMLLRDPRILLMDEATASIDEQTEKKVDEAVKIVMNGRTCFIIAHRLSTIIACDKILVFDQGKIVEEGNHKSLMAQKGFYYRLAKEQK